jgi:hypothetical protein
MLRASVVECSKASALGKCANRLQSIVCRRSQGTSERDLPPERVPAAAVEVIESMTSISIARRERAESRWHDLVDLVLQTRDGWRLPPKSHR